MIIEKNKSREVYWPDLHKTLDFMITAFLDESGKRPSKTTLLEFMEWSAIKADNAKRDLTRPARKEVIDGR